MRMNIENAARSRDKKIVQFALDNVVTNLKELRDRTAQGDLKSLDEFFTVFVFDDDIEYTRLPPIIPLAEACTDGQKTPPQQTNNQL